MSTFKEILITGRGLIDSPNKWTQKALARNKNGDSISYLNIEAVSFCSMGALYRAYFDLHKIKKCHKTLSEHVIPGFNSKFAHPDFNDSSSWEGVMELWDLAIKECKS